MLAVHYEEGEFDEFHHKYEYDADNRVTTTYTSRNGVVWEKEQKNFYYLTGPLMRQEIGDKTVQAMDYAYTAQGWIKVMNAGSISSTRDMGRDSYSENISGSTSTNMNFGTDASGFVLNYFDNTGHNGDYWAPALATAGTTSAYIPQVTSTATQADYFSLYNGNISYMVTALTDENESVIDNQLTAYKYDQLNRIKQVRAHRNYNTSTNAFSGSTGNDGKYQEDFSYDRNGNILSVQRNGNNTGGTQAMDDFTYYYYDNTGGLTNSPTYPSGGLPLNATNKLAYVEDAITSTNYTTDIDDQTGLGSPGYNYTYDGNGNLITDASEEISNIAWYANGKIKSITRTSTSTKSDLEFIYDASGNRIVKITKPRDGLNTAPESELHWTYTYYVRDASGNVMSVYERTFEHVSGDDYKDNFDCVELDIYGSKRVGLLNADSLSVRTFTSTGFADGYGEEFVPSYDAVVAGFPCNDHCKYNYRRELGNKQYEVTNHLGNVLATVSDRKLHADDYAYTTWSSGTKYAYDATRNIYYQNASGTYQRTLASSDSKADFYTADVISYSDYYAFGAQMDGRMGGSYRFDYNGKETDPESDLQDYGMRIYNARLGRFLSVDPLSAEYPWNSTYAYAENDVIRCGDLDGCEKIWRHTVVTYLDDGTVLNTTYSREFSDDPMRASIQRLTFYNMYFRASDHEYQLVHSALIFFHSGEGTLSTHFDPTDGYASVDYAYDDSWMSTGQGHVYDPGLFNPIFEADRKMMGDWGKNQSRGWASARATAQCAGEREIVARSLKACVLCPCNSAQMV